MALSLKRQIYDTAGSYTFTPPDPLIQVVWADIWGGGSGGVATNEAGVRANAGGGGGAGEFVERKLIPIIGGTLPIVVGVGGLGGSFGPSLVPPGNGGDSSVGGVIALGGVCHFAAASAAYPGGWGGGPLGGHSSSGHPPVSARGFREGPFETGGNSGGGGGNRLAGTETQPYIAPGCGTQSVSASGAGGGGANSMWGPGGDGGTDPSGNGADAGGSAAGGGGQGPPAALGHHGGTGGAGKVIIYYLVGS